MIPLYLWLSLQLQGAFAFSWLCHVGFYQKAIRIPCSSIRNLTPKPSFSSKASSSACILALMLSGKTRWLFSFSCIEAYVSVTSPFGNGGGGGSIRHWPTEDSSCASFVAVDLVRRRVGATCSNSFSADGFRRFLSGVSFSPEVPILTASAWLAETCRESVGPCKDG